MESKILCCGETSTDKNSFKNNKSSININEVEINKIVLSDKTSYGGKGSLSTTLDIGIKIEPFHH